MDFKEPYDPHAAGPPQEPLPFKDDSQNPDSRQMAMLAHLLGALLGFLGPLIIWLTKKDTSPFVDDQGKEALNFQLTILIIHLLGFVVVVVSCGFLFFVPLVPWVLQLVFGIIGAMKAKEGEFYRYPFSIRMIS